MKKRIHPRIILPLAVLFLGGCATGYHSKGFTGGFSETQLDRNVWVVTFSGNGYTSNERASDFVMLRSAQLSLEGGFPFFIIVDRANLNSHETYTQPSSSYTTSSVSVVGNTAYGSSQTTTYGGQTYVMMKPGRENTIVCFAERPQVIGPVYDAAFILNSIASKYGIQEDVRSVGSSKQSASAADAPGPCQKDTDCKGKRLCEHGHCVNP
jgi:hypothetical protein